MKIPDWAERAFKRFEPGASHGHDAPEPDSLEQWTSICARFKARWSDLQTDSWNVPGDNDPRYEQLRRDHTYPPSEYVKQCILECAIESCWAMGANKDPEQVIAAAKKINELNEEISHAAGVLATLFDERQRRLDQFHLRDRNQSADESWPDAFRLLGAFKLALKRPENMRWASVAKAEIVAFMRSASSQSRSVPTWADLLNQVADDMPRTVYALDDGDVAILGSTSKKTRWSPWSLALIGRLDGSLGMRLHDGFLLSCLTNLQLSLLLEVALGAPAAEINDKQIAALKKRYCERRVNP